MRICLVVCLVMAIPMYRGVWQRNNKWVYEVCVPNDKSTRIWLGTYPMLEMATRAHNIAALTL